MTQLPTFDTTSDEESVEMTFKILASTMEAPWNEARIMKTIAAAVAVAFQPRLLVLAFQACGLSDGTSVISLDFERLLREQTVQGAIAKKRAIEANRNNRAKVAQRLAATHGVMTGAVATSVSSRFSSVKEAYAEDFINMARPNGATAAERDVLANEYSLIVSHFKDCEAREAPLGI